LWSTLTSIYRDLDRGNDEVSIWRRSAAHGATIEIDPVGLGQGSAVPLDDSLTHN
jgi:hypothetical protein